MRAQRHPRSNTGVADAVRDAPAAIVFGDITVRRGSSLQYDPLSQTYTYVWKNDRARAGSCRQLSVALNDGAVYRANFQLR